MSPSNHKAYILLLLTFCVSVSSQTKKVYCFRIHCCMSNGEMVLHKMLLQVKNILTQILNSIYAYFNIYLTKVY